jgi:hypothetical protein
MIDLGALVLTIMENKYWLLYDIKVLLVPSTSNTSLHDCQDKCAPDPYARKSIAKGRTGEFAEPRNENQITVGL